MKKKKKSKLTSQVKKRAKKDLAKTFGGPSTLDRLQAAFGGPSAEQRLRRRTKKSK